MDMDMEMEMMNATTTTTTTNIEDDGSIYSSYDSNAFDNGSDDMNVGSSSTTSETESPVIVSNLSNTQEKVLSLIPIVTSLLSIMGSSIIIWLVFTNNKSKNKKTSTNKKKFTPYKRLLLGLSICDLILSVSIPLHAFLLPKENPNIIGNSRVWAIGNQATCTTIGFFTQFGMSALLYNSMLSFYFILTLRFQYKFSSTPPPNNKITKVEFFMHTLSIGFPLSTAIIGTIIGLYHESMLSLSCYVNDYPLGCDYDPDVKCKSPLYGLIWGGIIIFGSFVTIFINNIIIFVHVKSTLLKGNRFSTETLITQLTNKAKADKAKTTQQQNDGGEDNRDNRESEPDAAGSGSSPSSSHDDNSNNNNNNSEINNNNNNNLQQVQQQRYHNRNNNNNNNKQEERVYMVATQAFCYVISFFICYVWVLIIAIIESFVLITDATDVFPLLVIASIFVPFNGFFNMIVYIRPKFITTTKQYPQQSKFWCFKRILFGESIKEVKVKKVTTQNQTSLQEQLQQQQQQQQQHQPDHHHTHRHDPPPQMTAIITSETDENTNNDDDAVVGRRRRRPSSSSSSSSSPLPLYPQEQQQQKQKQEEEEEGIKDDTSITSRSSCSLLLCDHHHRKNEEEECIMMMSMVVGNNNNHNNNAIKKSGTTTTNYNSVASTTTTKEPPENNVHDDDDDDDEVGCWLHETTTTTTTRATTKTALLSVSSSSTSTSSMVLLSTTTTSNNNKSRVVINDDDDNSNNNSNISNKPATTDMANNTAAIATVEEEEEQQQSPTTRRERSSRFQQQQEQRQEQEQQRRSSNNGSYLRKGRPSDGLPSLHHEEISSRRSSYGLSPLHVPSFTTTTTTTTTATTTNND